jgi:glycosyltransferase involved in cell wall biosynthesis
MSEDMNKTSRPLVSVITVVYNGEKCREKTINSVLNQDYENIEYIVIDGGSKDKTKDIIKKYSGNISHWVSEPDKGIYDAMNKGIRLAKGDWINFMNAGDLFYSHDAVSMIFNVPLKDADLVYGDCEVVYNDKLKRIKKAAGDSDFWKGIPCSHQSLFARSSILKKQNFNVHSRNSADFEFFYTAYLKGHKCHYRKIVVSSVSAQGSSDLNRMRTIRENWRIVSCLSRSTLKDAYYILSIIDCKTRQFLRSVMPKFLVEFIIRNKK